MEKILELSESYNSTYPQHFQIFLDNCVKRHADNFSGNDYLFAAVYFLILETGFTPVKSTELAKSDSASFDIRKLRSVTHYSDEHVAMSKKFDNSFYFYYNIALKLGIHSSNICELQGVPSAETNAHLIINLFSKNSRIIKSLCLNTETYVERSNSLSEHKYSLKDLRNLSILVKNELAVYVKDLILTNEEEGCCGNLVCLPEEIQMKIVWCLKTDPSSIQKLSATCTYFYNFISKYSKLWEYICFEELGDLALNKAVEAMKNDGETNVFKAIFVKLKNKGVW